MQAERAPLQAQLDTNNARLSTLEVDVGAADRALEDLRRQIGATAARIELVGSAARTRSEEEHNGLVERHNELARRRREMADEHTRLRAVTRELVEALNWTR
jgi:chromosome segregation ATPase